MKLYLMQLAQLPPHDGFPGAPVPGYLVQTDEGQNVLIDTGVPRDRGADSPFRVDEGEDVISQLGRLGLAPEDVDYLVCTHYDIDHAGNHAAFPAAELVVQRAHHEAARGGMPRLQPLRAQWDQPDERFRFVDGDAELLPGLELIDTSGHVPGHQSVLVRLPETGPVLLTIDAIQNQHLADPDTRAMTPFDHDEAGVRASTRKLMDLARREGAALVVFGHDPEQWHGLRKLPDFYS